MKQNKKQTRRIRKLVMIFAFTAVLVSVATYAWFIGLTTVNVSSFDVEIAGTESLMLSLNGKDWSQTIDISEASLDSKSYVDHTNSWGGGLSPVSTMGEMDATASRMRIFEKASLTPTPGGYRLMASRVNNTNTSQKEPNGYVVFDLFVRNFSGRQYVPAVNMLEEEAIYLTVDSKVTVSSSGVENTGIENSVRVAFAQIGRVSGNDIGEFDRITGISCNGTPGQITGGVTGICRPAQIWEPNDNAHTADAISWYNTSCRVREEEDITKQASFTNDRCGTIVNGQTYPTYVVKGPIESADMVDVYDGPAYNSWTDSDGFLADHKTFTDTMKNRRGVERPHFMMLAPNSITKIRVYVYLEGQDIDNYDFASIGKSISVQFGFTKSRFTEDDIGYLGPDVNQGAGPNGPDFTPPVITLKGTNPMTIVLGETFTDPGAEATDNIDGDFLETDIKVSGVVNTQVAGQYILTYTVVDSSGNVATRPRLVIVED